MFSSSLLLLLRIRTIRACLSVCTICVCGHCHISIDWKNPLISNTVSIVFSVHFHNFDRNNFFSLKDFVTIKIWPFYFYSHISLFFVQLLLLSSLVSVAFLSLSLIPFHFILKGMILLSIIHTRKYLSFEQ